MGLCPDALYRGAGADSVRRMNKLIEIIGGMIFMFFYASCVSMFPV